MSDHPYGDHVALVLESCPDASEEDIVKAFKQYEEEFFIPPQDAMHSIIRKLQVSSTPTGTGRSASRRKHAHRQADAQSRAPRGIDR